MSTHFEHRENCVHAENERASRAARTQCLDFFAVAGMLQGAKEKQVLDLFVKAFESNPDYALRTVFYARDICGGAQERRMFRLLMRRLAFLSSSSVGRNMELFAEYGRFDDLLVLLDTPCEKEMAALIGRQIRSDLESAGKGGMISMLGKWLPDPKSFSFETRREAAHLAQLLGMNIKRYAETRDALREHLQLIEWKLSRKEFSFDYRKLPGGKGFEYRQAAERSDPERYIRFVREKQAARPRREGMSACEIVRRCLDERTPDEQERRMLNEAWNALPAPQETDGAAAVVDLSRSMYTPSGRDGILPASAAVALGMYFAQQGKDCFHNRFIPVARKPHLVEIEGEDVLERARFCASFHETADIDLYEVFMTLLVAAVKSNLPREDMPRSLYIITDASFDVGVVPDRTVFEDAREKFEDYGYRLPDVVYWNVNSRRMENAVELSEKGITMVSGVSGALFEMVMGQEVAPERLMQTVLESERYRRICA